MEWDHPDVQYAPQATTLPPKEANSAVLAPQDTVVQTAPWFCVKVDILLVLQLGFAPSVARGITQTLCTLSVFPAAQVTTAPTQQHRWRVRLATTV